MGQAGQACHYNAILFDLLSIAFTEPIERSINQPLIIIFLIRAHQPNQRHLCAIPS